MRRYFADEFAWENGKTSFYRNNEVYAFYELLLRNQPLWKLIYPFEKIRREVSLHTNFDVAVPDLLPAYSLPIGLTPTARPAGHTGPNILAGEWRMEAVPRTIA